jgi:two-component system CheB/CheR fusion protein
MSPTPPDDTQAPPLEDIGQPRSEAPVGASRLGFPVVGIGASAGGLEALEALTHKLSPDQMAFVVVQHLAPGHVSMLSDILARGTTMRVVTIEHGMHIQPGTIYVAPPTVELSLDGEELRVARESDVRGPRHSIDTFLRSLARVGGSKAIGVVLSGSGSDGTLGLKAIQEEGGITFVQEPDTASQPSMPQSALDAGCADFSLTPAEIGDELMRLSAHPYVGRARPIKSDDRDAIMRIYAQLRGAYGVDFTQYKRTTVERRIGRRMALHRLEKIDDYLSFLASDGNELRSLYNDLLIGVTSFFRDTEPFDALKNVVFPRLLENHPADAPIRIWVAGCSTGEEAYSITISLIEFLGERATRHKIQIFATDVDDDALSRARFATYPASIEIDVSPERLQRFFVRTDKGYQVARPVRDVVVFARHNLGKDPPFSRLDVITCRNVLIYMQAALQKKVLRIFHYALNPDAYLLLGTSETIGDAADLFALVDRKTKVYAKKNIPATRVFDVSLSGRSPHGEDGEAMRSIAGPIVSVAQIADRKVIEKYAPAGVIVDEGLDIVQFRGRTGPYLEPAPGVATLNLLKLAHPELLVALRTTVHRALAEGGPVTSPAIPLRSDRELRSVSVDVMPLPDTAGRRCLLVLFNEVSLPKQSSDGPADAAEGPAANPRILELERDLTTTKEYLQSTIEELEAANEEMQSSNEELQSTNEELQSTNEELETSKEELQSINEELTTVNDELHDRMAQLSAVNDDLRNVMLSGSSLTVIIGADLRIRRFSAAAEKLLSLIPGDVGRPIGYLRNVMSSRDIEQIAADALASVTTREQRVRCVDGSWYLMRMMPYVTMDHMIRGLVVELVKTTPPAAAAEGGEMPLRAEQVLSVFPQPLMLLDRHVRLVWANRAFFEAFGVGPGTLGRPLVEAWGNPNQPAELWSFLEEIASGKVAGDVVIDHPFGRADDRPMRFVGRIVPSEGERSALALVFMQEA